MKQAMQGPPMCVQQQQMQVLAQMQAQGQGQPNQGSTYPPIALNPAGDQLLNAYGQDYVMVPVGGAGQGEPTVTAALAHGQVVDSQPGAPSKA